MWRGRSRVPDEDCQQELLLFGVQSKIAVQQIVEHTPPNGRARRPNAVAARIRFCVGRIDAWSYNFQHAVDGATVIDRRLQTVDPEYCALDDPRLCEEIIASIK